MKELKKALWRTACAAQECGISLEEFETLFLSVHSKTNLGGHSIGNSFKTIFTRLQREDVLNKLSKYNIQINNKAGRKLPIIQILKNISQKLVSSKSEHVTNISTLLGGTFQTQLLKLIF